MTFRSYRPTRSCGPMVHSSGAMCSYSPRDNKWRILLSILIGLALTRGRMEEPLSFTASSPVAVIGLRGFENERSEVLLSTLPVTDWPARRNHPVVFPHVADGGGLSSRIILTNPTDQTLTGRLQFISQSGQAWSVVLDGQAGTAFDYSIPAQGSKTFVTANASADVHIGWIRVVPATGAAYPAGVLIFSFRPAGVVITEAAGSAAAPFSALRFLRGKNKHHSDRFPPCK